MSTDKTKRTSVKDTSTDWRANASVYIIKQLFMTSMADILTPLHCMQLRKECFKRLERDRASLLQASRHRRTGTTTKTSEANDSSNVETALRRMIGDACEALTPVQQKDKELASGTPPSPTRSSDAPSLNNQPDDIMIDELEDTEKNNSMPFPLNEAEYEELLRALEAKLYEDLLQVRGFKTVVRLYVGVVC